MYFPAAGASAQAVEPLHHLQQQQSSNYTKRMRNYNVDNA
jgi:hypothetical protein